MSRSTYMALVGLALAVAACAHAARLPYDTMTMFDELPDSVIGMQHGPSDYAAAVDEATTGMIQNMLSSNMHSDLEAILAQHEAAELEKGKGKGKWPIQIVTKYLVKPDLHVNFVFNWQRFHAKSEHEVGKGLIHHSLSKVAGDNIVWTGYTVYKGFEAAWEHLRSEALRDFGSFLMNSNVAVEYHLLFNVGGCHCHKESNEDCSCWSQDDAAHLAASADEDKVDKKKRGWPVRLATKFIVPPSLGREFVEEWRKVAEKLEDAKGKLVNVLNKPADDNTVFVAYTAWESHSDFWAAAKKAEKFIKYIEDKNIVAVTRKLWRVPEHHW